MTCFWRTAPSGAFTTLCGKRHDWRNPDLDDYKFCPFCGKHLVIIPAG